LGAPNRIAAANTATADHRNADLIIESSRTGERMTVGRYRQ
jgi:hypothetical protein